MEQDWVEQAGKGNREAFTRLMTPYRQRLFGFMRLNVATPQTAEDLVQETLIKVWLALPAYRERGRFIAWLMTIAQRVLIDHRRHRHEDFPLEDVRLTASAAANPELQLEHKASQQRLVQAVKALAPATRQVFLMRQQSELTFREIAAAMDLPLNTVLGHMHRARTRLKKEVIHEAN